MLNSKKNVINQYYKNKDSLGDMIESMNSFLDDRLLKTYEKNLASIKTGEVDALKIQDSFN